MALVEDGGRALIRMADRFDTLRWSHISDSRHRLQYKFSFNLSDSDVVGVAAG